MKIRRVTVNPRQMGGVPCIRGLRIPVGTGMSDPEILDTFPDLETEDIGEAVRCAAKAVRD